MIFVDKTHVTRITFMSNFNEYQNGMPDLGKTYWQDLKSNEQKENNSLNSLVEMNCKTIFEEDSKNVRINNPSIFKN